MRTPRTAVAALLGLMLIGASTSGCSINIVDHSERPAAAEKPASADESPVDESPGDDSPGDDSPGDESRLEEPQVEEPQEESDLAQNNATERERLSGEATTTMQCPHDTPLTQHGSIIRVEGPCAKLSIDLDAGVIITDDVEELIISGHGNVVYTQALGRLEVIGDVNTVYWTGEAPELSDTGSANTVTRG